MKIQKLFLRTACGQKMWRFAQSDRFFLLHIPKIKKCCIFVGIFPVSVVYISERHFRGCFQTEVSTGYEYNRGKN